MTRRQAAHQTLRHRRAMTLIEMLAVIVILSMVAGALGLRLAGNSQAAEARATMAGWRDLDAHARIAAQIEGAVRLQLDDDAGGISLRLVKTGTSLVHLRWPPAFEGSLSNFEGQSVSAIAFDSRGRSADYAMNFRGREDGINVIQSTTQVCGLTGWFVEEKSP